MYETSGYYIPKSKYIPDALQLDPEGRWRMDGGDEGKEGGSVTGRMKEQRVGPSNEAKE